MGYFTATFVFVQKKGVIAIKAGMLLEIRGKMTRNFFFFFKKRTGKINSCCHDIHVFMPVRKGVRGILWDTETAECQRRTDVLGEKKRK